MSFGVTLLVAVGLSVVTLYTYHQNANLHKPTAVGPSAASLDAVSTRNPGIVDATTMHPADEPVQSTGSQGAQPPKPNGQHDNGNSPFDNPNKVITNMGPDNPALLKAKPAFLHS